MKNCQYCNKIFKDSGIATHQTFCKSNPNKKIPSKTHGGYRRGSGRGKSGWYNGIFCDSSWELAYILYCEKHEIPIKRYFGEQLFYTSIDGSIHEYIPDFIINDEQIVEIKGYETEITNIKKFHFPNIVILTKIEMGDILKQVESIYGKDFILLYNNIKPEKKERRFPEKPKPIKESKPRIKKLHKMVCGLCKKEFERSKQRQYCSRECSKRSQQRFEIDAEHLKELIWKYPTSTVSTMFNVSDKAIEKRCKKFGIDKPPRGYWAKQHTNYGS